MSDDDTCAFTGMNKKDSLIRGETRSGNDDRVGKGRIVWVDGWNEGERVPTWRAYAAFIEQYRDIGLALSHAGIRLVNCTEGGARIPMLAQRAFAEVLTELSTGPIDARAVLLSIHDAAPRRTLEDYEAAIQSARRRLDELEREVERGRDFERSARERIAWARGEQQQVEILRGIARCEKKIRAQLERAPWLDALVQPEIYAAVASQRRTERHEPTIEDLMAESRFLIEAAGNGVLRARQWFELFEQSFDVHSNDEIELATGIAAAGGHAFSERAVRPLADSGDGSEARVLAQP